ATFNADEFARTVYTRVPPRPARAAAGRWRSLRRVVAGMAAAIIVGVALWTQQQKSDPAPVAATAAPDRIFAAFDERALVGKNQSDEIFNGSFHADVIFRSSGG